MRGKQGSLCLWLLGIHMFISAFTFGGGYVVVPMVRKYFVLHKKLFGEDELMEMAAVSQSVPGAIAVNLAAVTGYRAAGVLGAITSATASVPVSYTHLDVYKRQTDTGYYGGRGEGRLFHFRKKVLRVSVKFQNADFVERILAMPPDFCDVERIFVVFKGLFFCHDLYIHCPARIIASFNRFIQISAMAFPVFGDEGFRFRVRKVFDSLLGFKVELAPYTFIFIIVEGEGMFSIKMHMPERSGNTPI